MSSLHNLKRTDHARLWSFEGMLLPLDGFFSTFGESIHGLISFDHLKIGRASRRGGCDRATTTSTIAPLRYASIRTVVGSTLYSDPVHNEVRPDVGAAIYSSVSPKEGHRLTRSHQRPDVSGAGHRSSSVLFLPSVSSDPQRRSFYPATRSPTFCLSSDLLS